MANEAALSGGAQGAAAGSSAGPWGAAIGGALGIAGGIMGGKAAEKAAAKAAEQQRDMYEKNVAILEAVGIPTVEAQKIALEKPESVGDLVNETLGPSAYENISLDPQLRQNQMDVLAQLQGLSETGMGIEDQIAFDQLMQQTAAQDQSRQKAIVSDMAQRGTLDSGVEAALRSQTASTANNQAMQQAQALAKQSQQNRMAALNSIASQSGQLDNLDYQREAQKATAADTIQQFNANTRNQANQYNVTNKQNIANQGTSIANQQETYNKGLIQQEHNNKMNQAAAKMGLNTNYGANQAANTLTAGQGQANMYAGVGSGLGDIVASASKSGMFSSNPSSTPQMDEAGGTTEYSKDYLKRK